MPAPRPAPDASEAARLLAARRRVVGPRQCAECGAEFVATTAGRYKRRYCSSRCQRRAWYHAHRQHALAVQRAYRARQRAAPPPDADAARAADAPDAPDAPGGPDVLLSPDAVARWLGVTRPTLLRLIRERGLPAVQVSARTWRIPRRALEAWLAAHTRGAAR